MLPKALTLVSTVLMLMSLAFSVLGTTPLLILKHRVAMDSRVIRQVFTIATAWSPCWRRPLRLATL